MKRRCWLSSARQRFRPHWQVSTRRRLAVGARLSSMRGAGQLGSGRAALDALSALTGSPVVAVNRALAIAESHGASAALDALQEVAADARLTEYQPYWAARVELLARTGEHDEARRAYEIAIGLERDPAVRRFLQRRQATLSSAMQLGS